MQLYYFDKEPNYGDALNPWLWPRVLGDQLQVRSSTLFLGIGTILKRGLPEAERYAVLGSGGGYEPFPAADHRWNFYAVRGPLTAQGLGLQPEAAAIDGAYLLRKLSLPPPVSTGPRIGFMPHWETRLRVPWKKICAMSGLRYLDPQATVEQVLGQLQGCDGVIAEAMHAAITADALRIRWLPVRLGRQFLDFKWQDWLGSVELSADRVALPAVEPRVNQRKHESLLRRGYRTTVNSVADILQTRALVSRLTELRRNFERDSSCGYLSDERTMNSRIDRLERALDRMRHSES